MFQSHALLHFRVVLWFGLLPFGDELLRVGLLRQCHPKVLHGSLLRKGPDLLCQRMLRSRAMSDMQRRKLRQRLQCGVVSGVQRRNLC